MAFTAVYDASVLHPASVRDLLVRLGMTGRFQARWTEEILDEMVASVARRQPEVPMERLTRTRELMCEAIPDCLVSGYEQLIDGLELPDPDDRHVLAAAIRASADVIVTFNLRDFPGEQLDRYSIDAQSPDVFVLHLVDLAPAAVAGVLHEQAADLRNPPRTVEELVERLASNGLSLSMAALRQHLEG